MPRKFVSVPVINDPALALGERQILVIASDPTLDRTKDVMKPEGVVLDNYRENPIVLASHDPRSPIGTAAVAVKNNRVEALIDFAPKGVSVKADEYCGLAKAGVLRAVSVGFDPIDFEPNKSGGYDFNKWELMELSLVSVPANPGARIIARSFEGESKEADLKVGASRNLPIGDDPDWDAEGAAASIFDHCELDGDSPDKGFARKGFLVYDAATAGERAAYKLPFAKMVEGRLTVSPSGLRGAAHALAESDLPDDVREKAEAVIAHYEAKLAPEGEKAGRALSAANAEHVAAIGKALGKLARLHGKASDLHDEMKGLMAEAHGHAAVALDHAKALSKPKPDEDDPDPEDDANEELAFEVERRKRQIAIAEAAITP